MTADVTKVLGFTNGPKAVRDHVLAGQRRVERIVHPLSKGGFTDTTVINEPGLYRLIMRSKVQNAP